jgi:anionic cell wall polymer biosynthesis LytR-Cps2A-Psr (LCP) family protein
VWGAAALAYWRVRYIGLGSDLERIQRDQFLMASIVQKIKRTDLFGNLNRTFKIISDIASSLTTDSQLTQSTMISLARGLRGMSLADVHFISVPVVAYPQNPNWVQWAPQASALFRAIAHDRKLPRSHRAGHPRTRPPAPKAPLSHLTKHYGGITARANVCHDSGAFVGPLGRR